ncbi:hypothetical protein [Nannocystis bainbridge]|uniref:Uncharacterized protein n=1 Tax=Nannocystis bainbridge TaxID=2995303 RepID=A0ABT5E3V8_9BACT|nr:hypothetical protein [Nannocystis bainbridge]MDC0719416.1 hypothetical protein [Nannocystis bainbridge]
MGDLPFGLATADPARDQLPAHAEQTRDRRVAQAERLGRDLIGGRASDLEGRRNRVQLAFDEGAGSDGRAMLLVQRWSEGPAGRGLNVAYLAGEGL